jgi:hypothetical protein
MGKNKKKDKKRKAKKLKEEDLEEEKTRTKKSKEKKIKEESKDDGEWQGLDAETSSKTVDKKPALLPQSVLDAAAAAHAAASDSDSEDDQARPAKKQRPNNGKKKHTRPKNTHIRFTDADDTPADVRVRGGTTTVSVLPARRADGGAGLPPRADPGLKAVTLKRNLLRGRTMLLARSGGKGARPRMVRREFAASVRRS